VTLVQPKSLALRTVWVVLFAVALAYIESAVVVYLRALFYPDGFTFPLDSVLADDRWMRFLYIEVAREVATLVVLLAGSILMGFNRQTRWAFFLVVFAVWDIFYYVWLKVLLDWPASVLDWDILFLIPLIWAGPVLAPVLVSLVMLAAAARILYLQTRKRQLRLKPVGMIGLAAAGGFIIVQFCIGGHHMAQADYKSFFSWPVFIVLLAGGLIIILVAKND